MGEVLARNKLLYTLLGYMDEYIGKQLEDEEKERVRRYRNAILGDPRNTMNAPLGDGRLHNPTVSNRER